MKKRFGDLFMVVLCWVLVFTAVRCPSAWAGNRDDIKIPPQVVVGPAYVEGQVLIKMKPGASVSAVRSRFSALASRDRGFRAKAHTFKRFPAIKAAGGQELVVMKCPGRTTEELLEAFQDQDGVEIAEPDYIISIDDVPDDSRFNELWGLENTGQNVNGATGTSGADISATDAWDRMGSNDTQVIVAVVDTGVDYTHPDLAENMWVNTEESNGETGVDDDGNGWVDDIYGIDAYNNDSDPYDDNYHGTHVAGTIAAVSDNGTGVTGVTRNRARIMALKFLASNGNGATSDAVDCIEYLLEMNERDENNVVVINASWGSESSSSSLKSALQTAADAGIILAAASGNDGLDCDGEQEQYPSSFEVENIVSVAATSQYDRMASFSNYGAIGVDIGAPGVKILSTKPGGGYRFLNGTSMATPHVSGALALMASIYPDETMDERISRLYAGVDRLDSLGGIISTDGRLNLDKALDPNLELAPLVKNFELTGERTISIEGSFFKDDTGRVVFYDLQDSDNGIDADVISWSDTAVTVEKPPYSGGYFHVINDQGNSSRRHLMDISLWSELNDAQNRRSSATACLLDGNIYNFGGFSGSSTSLNTWEMYTPQTNTWTYNYFSRMPRSRGHLTSTVLNSKIYLIGGYTTADDGGNLDLVTVFDPEDQSFTDIESLPEAICFARAVTVGSRIYVTGGMDDDDKAMSTVYLFDPKQENGSKWQAFETTMNTRRYAHGAVTLGNKIYIFGGAQDDGDDDVYLASGEILDPDTGTITAMADMPMTLARFGVACDGRYIYTVGGTNSDFYNTPKTVVMRYDTQTDTWSQLLERQLAVAKLAGSAVFVEGVGLYSITGAIESKYFSYYPSKSLSFLDVSAITDSDADLIPDADDNCRLTANAAQLDADNDGYGNTCDCDLNNDDRVNMVDFVIFRDYWGTSQEVADFDGSGNVSMTDFVIFRSHWGAIAPFE